MKIGIIGLQGSGKTTVFEMLIKESGQEIKYGTYGEERLKPHLGNIPVLDVRLEELSRIFKPKKTTFIELTFIDRPGFEMVHAKEADALMLVVGSFLDRDGVKEIKDVEADMIVSDLGIVQNRLKKLDKEIKAKELKDEAEYELLLKCNKALEDGGASLRSLELTENEKAILHGFQLLTSKPILVVLNCHESSVGGEVPVEIKELLEKNKVAFVKFSAEIELEIMGLKEDERPEFLNALGIEKPAKEKLVKAALDMLSLVSFFTVKGDEVRAWAIRDGTKALDAAGKVHTDMKRGFIRAEVINFKDFIESFDSAQDSSRAKSRGESGGSFHEAKARGHLRLEGRDYIVKNGDIIDFRFSV